MLSGYKALHKDENGMWWHIVDFVVPYIAKNEIHRVLDPKVPPPTLFEMEALAYVGSLAADCVSKEGRPSMTKIVKGLQRAFEVCVDPDSEPEECGNWIWYKTNLDFPLKDKKKFPFKMLLKATNNFSQDRKIETNSFGSVYRATLDDHRVVAVKRTEGSYMTWCEEDYDNAFLIELEALSSLNHKNVVHLLGFCDDSNVRVVVYDYMENGTLRDHLHKFQSTPLMSWATQIIVALDAARGIEYLHVYAVPPIIHRESSRLTYY
nr:serine/threonine-protein kinase-like protein CCR4 [Quercus suber]